MNRQIKFCIECKRENIGGDNWYEPNSEIIIAYQCSQQTLIFVQGYCPTCSAQQKFNEEVERL